MLRVLLHYLLPLILPFAAYFAYVALARGRVGPWLERTPWLILTASGVALLAASLVTWGLTSGDPAGGIYLPPRLEDGRIVPPRVIEPQ